mgnify:CR=1 FL=1
MLRSKGLTDKVIVLGIDGMDPRFSKAMVDEGKMPNLKKLIEMGSAREDLMLLGAMPTITPPLWATLATGCYPMTHGIVDYAIPIPGEIDMRMEAFLSPFCKAEQLWNVTAEAGKKTLVWHWPGGAWPPSSDSENLYVVDGTTPGALGFGYAMRDGEVTIIATTKAAEPKFVPYGASHTNGYDGDGSDLVPQLVGGHNTSKKDYHDELWNEFKEGIACNGYVPKRYMDYRLSHLMPGDSNMDVLKRFPQNVSVSPISEPEGWANAPEGAKEFTLYLKWGHVKRPALILKNAEGKYDKVAVYASKDAVEPLFVLDEDTHRGFLTVTKDKFSQLMYNKTINDLTEYEKEKLEAD